MTNMSDLDGGPVPAPILAVIAGIHSIMRADLLADGAEVDPAALLLRDGEIVEVMVTQFSSDDSKDLFAEGIRQRASKHSADAVCLISEAWALLTPDDEKRPEGSIENMPNRQDVVMYRIQTRAGDWLGRAPIMPAETGRALGEITWSGAGRHGGRFKRLLPPVLATREQIATFANQLGEKLRAGGIAPEMVAGPNGAQLVEAVERQLLAQGATTDMLTFDNFDDLLAELIRLYR